MSADKTAGRRNAGKPVRPVPSLPEPAAGCSTPDLIAYLSHEVKGILRGRKRRREDTSSDARPKRRQNGEKK
jgi:hypothetical protein